uniref:Kinetochore protein Spc24 n=1 Tax=Ganoderma boninense TaxID=34458 RepID=A0A5K1JZS9_9APHY|nr:Hsp70 [Ganoderma boninense]
MAINIKDTVKAMREMVPIIDPEDDYLTIAAAEEQTALTHDARQKELHEAHTKLKQLSKVLEAARVSATRPSTIPSAEEHVAHMNDLDATRLSLAKAINDAEGALAGKEAELARLKEETRALETSDPAAEHDLDATALRLALYKGLGFEPIMEKDSRMLVRAESGDVHCVTFTNRQKSDKDYADELWKLASS